MSRLLIIDIFSRHIAGHTVERAPSAVRAEELIRASTARNGIAPETVHTDRGTSMTPKKVSHLLIDPGVTRSHSRPKTSNDHPCTEARFTTTKYMSDPPERFDSLAHAPEWFDAFTAYYNHEHRHSGTGWHTPASVHFGTAEEVRDQRAVPLADAYPRHPPNASAATPDHPGYPSRHGSTTRPSAGNPHHKPHSVTTVSLNLKSAAPRVSLVKSARAVASS